MPTPAAAGEKEEAVAAAGMEVDEPPSLNLSSDCSESTHASCQGPLFLHPSHLHNLALLSCLDSLGYPHLTLNCFQWFYWPC